MYVCTQTPCSKGTARIYFVYVVCDWTTMKYRDCVAFLLLARDYIFTIHMQFVVLWLFDDGTALILHFFCCCRCCSFAPSWTQKHINWRDTESARDTKNCACVSVNGASERIRWSERVAFHFSRVILLVLFCRCVWTLFSPFLHSLLPRHSRHFQSTSKVKFQQFIVVLLDCGKLCAVRSFGFARCENHQGTEISRPRGMEFRADEYTMVLCWWWK